MMCETPTRKDWSGAAREIVAIVLLCLVVAFAVQGTIEAITENRNPARPNWNYPQTLGR